MPAEDLGVDRYLRVVDVSDWALDADFPTYPVGSQPKSVLICPSSRAEGYLVPAHRYLFKQPEGWQAGQIWSELVASEIGRMVRIDVPRCLIGVDADGRIGALVEFFFGYAGRPEERFVHGSDILQRAIVDKKRGRPHGARTNVRLCLKYGASRAVEDWARILAFDAIIGNTDRHPDNWGLIWTYTPGGLPTVRIAPAFDNATSLAYEQRVADLDPPWTTDRLERYVGKGLHHCGWSGADDVRGGHVSLCMRFADTYPDARPAMLDVCGFDERDLRERIDACARACRRVGLVKERASLMTQLVLHRRHHLRLALAAS